MKKSNKLFDLGFSVVFIVIHNNNNNNNFNDCEHLFIIFISAIKLFYY